MRSEIRKIWRAVRRLRLIIRQARGAIESHVNSITKTQGVVVGLGFFCLFLFSGAEVMAQGSLEGTIQDVINNLVRLLNIIIVGFIAWSGFLIAKGDGSGVNRLIYGVIGLVVVNAANLIINYFV